MSELFRSIQSMQIKPAAISFCLMTNKFKIVFDIKIFANIIGVDFNVFALDFRQLHFSISIRKAMTIPISFRFSKTSILSFDSRLFWRVISSISDQNNLINILLSVYMLKKHLHCLSTPTTLWMYSR